MSVLGVGGGGVFSEGGGVIFSVLACVLGGGLLKVKLQSPWVVFGEDSFCLARVVRQSSNVDAVGGIVVSWFLSFLSSLCVDF